MSQFNNSAQPSKRFGIAIVDLKDFDINKTLPAIFGYETEPEQKSSTKSGNDVAYWQTILIMLFWILALLALIKLLSMTYKILSRVARLRNVTAALYPKQSNLKGKNETSSLSDSGYGITYTAADHNPPSYNEVTSEGSPSSSASLVTITTFLTETADSNSLAESGLGSLHRLDGGSFALSIITEEDDGEVEEVWMEEDSSKNENETEVKKAVEQIEQKQGTDQIVPDVIVQSSNQESKKVVEKYQL